MCATKTEKKKEKKKDPLKIMKLKHLKVMSTGAN